MGQTIAILIPCYNEAKTIAKVVSDYRQAIPEAEIYVYDNNSTDRTDEIAREAGATIRYEHRQGKGNVIRTMFREIDADCYLMIDGDDTYPAENAREMIDRVLSHGADMVIGDRLSSTYFTENKRPFHNAGNVLVRKLVNWFFKGNVTDIMTGYRAFSRTFVKSFPIMSKGFEIETEMTIHALDKNLSLSSVPVGYRDRPAGSESKLSTFSDGFKVLKTIGKLIKDYRPLPFFGIISLILLVVSLVLFIPILHEFNVTGAVLRFPTLMISGFIAVAAFVILGVGLVLDTQGKKTRQTFEIQMNILEGIHSLSTSIEEMKNRPDTGAEKAEKKDQ